MSKSSPGRYRTTNWSSDNASLRKHGSLLIELQGGQMVINGDLIVTGDVIAAGVSLKTHTHGGVATGGSQTGKPS